MDDELQTTISEALEAGWRSNPGLKALVDDYVKFHWVLVAVGALVTLAFLFGSFRFLRSYWKHRRIDAPSDQLTRKVSLGFGVLSGTLGCLFGLLALVNASTALNPLPGFSSLVDTSTVQADSDVGRSLIDWIQSASSETPPAVEKKVEDRLAWQMPKAIICSLLLLVFGWLTVVAWKALLGDARRSRSWSRMKGRVVLGSGVGATSVSLLLLVMAIANAQASIAPLTISALGGS
jgi:hypothetical protein